MATLVFGTIGRVLGGPVGGIIGGIAGGFVDSALFGGGSSRSGPRLASLAVQSAAYGEPLPRIAGAMRVAGNIVWATPIRESQTTSGGGKHGPATTSYRYSASFAVVLAGRPIVRVGRVWADGKLLRNADGQWLSPVTMRVHDGGEDQPPDPLIAASEGAEATPAYRGLAYAVFEDLPLADYGNRIPNLSFEVLADPEAGLDAGSAAAAIAARPDLPAIAVSGDFPAIDGLVAAAAGSVRQSLAPLVDAAGIAVSGLTLRGLAPAATAIEPGETGTVIFGRAADADRRRRAGAAALPDSVAIGHFDSGRDFLAGLQRARRARRTGREDRSDLPVAMAPAAAKAWAEAALARAGAARETITLRLPWRHAAILAGDVIEYDAAAWRVRERRIEAMVVSLDLERLPAAAAQASAADGGRALPVLDSPAGPTVLMVLDLPSLGAAAATTPRLWLAAAGAAPGWRQAPVEVSSDGGASYTSVGLINAAATLGYSNSALPVGPRDRWDRHATVDVELLADAMWLESRPAEAVLAGANLALIGDELVQFSDATPLGARRFRLSGLLRGRRGTDAAIAGHVADEPFVLLDPARLLAFDPPPDLVGSVLRFRAAGTDDGDTEPVTLRLAGAALRPLSPAALTASADASGLMVTWQRRSRAGYAWLDFADAPLAEEREAYRVEVRRGDALVRTAEVAEPRFLYPAADRAADAGGAALTLAVAQLSAAIGPGPAATLVLPAT